MKSYFALDFLIVLSLHEIEGKSKLPSRYIQLPICQKQFQYISSACHSLPWILCGVFCTPDVFFSCYNEFCCSFSVFGTPVRSVYFSRSAAALLSDTLFVHVPCLQSELMPFNLTGDLLKLTWKVRMNSRLIQCLLCHALAAYDLPFSFLRFQPAG